MGTLNGLYYALENNIIKLETHINQYVLLRYSDIINSPVPYIKYYIW